jgi:hypothetical protein
MAQQAVKDVSYAVGNVGSGETTDSLANDTLDGTDNHLLHGQVVDVDKSKTLALLGQVGDASEISHVNTAAVHSLGQAATIDGRNDICGEVLELKCLK